MRSDRQIRTSGNKAIHASGVLVGRICVTTSLLLGLWSCQRAVGPKKTEGPLPKISGTVADSLTTVPLADTDIFVDEKRAWHTDSTGTYFISVWPVPHTVIYRCTGYRVKALRFPDDMIESGVGYIGNVRLIRE